MNQYSEIKVYKTLLELSENMDDEIESIYEDAKEAGYELNIKTSEEIEWEESEIEGFSEFPVVTQTLRLFIKDTLVAEWERRYGIECIDYTHTGLGGNWEPLRLDNEDGYEIEEMLEYVGIEIPLPDVPEPKSVDVSEE